VSCAWKGACAAVGLKGVRPLDLRHHAVTVIARNPNVTLRELMATIGHSSPVAALRYQHATAERSKAIADYLDDVISAAQNRQRP
jgi:integrase